MTSTGVSSLRAVRLVNDNPRPAPDNTQLGPFGLGPAGHPER